MATGVVQGWRRSSEHSVQQEAATTVVINVWFVIVGALLVLMALGGAVLKRLPLTSSLLYMGVGVALGPLAFGLVRFDPLQHAVALERLTELAVVVSLFTAGLKLRTPFTDKRWIPPVRLATLTMLVSIVLMTLIGRWWLGLPLGAAILLAAVLAPTDPVLASDVQVEHASDRSSLRFGLTGEAGLNDGTAFPFVMLGLGLLGHHELGMAGLRWVGVDLLWAATAGLAIGWGLGQALGRLTIRLRRNRDEEVGYEDLLVLGLIALSYGVALLLHAYGFLAVFAAGLALRHVEMKKTGSDIEPTRVLQDAAREAPEAATEKLATHEEAAPAYLAHASLGFSEQAERILEAAVVLVLGGMLTYADFSASTIAFVAAMFLVVRPLAVALTYYGKGTKRGLRTYFSWFGIRGIGSLYYLFYAMSHGLEEDLARRLLGLTLAVVATSMVVHGVSVTPIMNRYSREREAREKARSTVPLR